MSKIDQAMEELTRKSNKMKQEAINEMGAIDFHFQVPKFNTPLMMIPAILNELMQFNNAMQEFHMEEAEEAENPLEEIMENAHGQMWALWNSWNAVIGMVLTSKDPDLVVAFHNMMTGFAEEQIMKSKKKGN